MKPPIKHIEVGLKFDGNIKTVGILAQHDQQIYFEYDSDYVRHGLELSPIRLPLKLGVQGCDSSLFEGLPGLFNDSLPDGWGRLLLDRALRQKGVELQKLSPLDRLAHVGQSGMGALVYEPDHSQNLESAELTLDTLYQDSGKVLEGQATDVLNELLILNGSSAGARPKALIGFNPKTGQVIYGDQKLPAGYDHWIVKFTNSQDGPDAGAMEFIYSVMARHAGLLVPQTHLFPSKHESGFFAIKRFDRNEGKRIHMHTACGLLHSDHRIPSLDYQNLLELTMFLTRDVRELEKMFRLAVFNVMAHNHDDHSKNFSFLLDQTGVWKLSPAYDLTFSYGLGGEHSTMVMGKGDSIDKNDLRQLGKQVDLSDSRIEQIMLQTKESLERWSDLAKEYSISKCTRNQIYQKLMNFI